ncbi:family 43 glycosylhydrolase [Sphingobacterium hungaricum]
MITYIVAFALCSISLFTNCSKSATPEQHVPDTLSTLLYKNPVFQPVLADPSVVFDPKSSNFYAYGTQDNWADGQGSRMVPILESKNLVDWKVVGSAFNKRPDWKKDGGIWAPDINYVNGEYYLYYSLSTWGDPDPAVGLAIAKTPLGPFEDQGKLFSSLEVNVPNSIDPFYYAENNKQYIFWGSFSSAPEQGTFAIELNSDGKSIKNINEKTKIAAGDFEAVMIHKRDGFYYFFGSKGSCCEGANSKYHVLVARSENLLGPYLDKSGKDIRERGAGTAFLKGNSVFVGTGHNASIVTDKNNKDWLLYHGIDKNQGTLSNGTSRRVLLLDEVRWENGWPIIQNGTSSTEAVQRPVF